MTMWNRESFDKAVRQAEQGLSMGGVPVGEVVELDDTRCMALMTAFRTRCPEVRAEDIGEA